MAKAKKFYIQPRRNGQWVITVRVNGKTVAACPRSRYKHLDGQPLHNVEHWAAENLTHPEPQPRSDIQLTGWVEQFAAFYRQDRERARGTCDEHRRHLLGHVIPYFLSRDPPLRDPNQWPVASVRMLSVLRQQGLTNHQIYRCNIALRRFYRWLQEERHVLAENVLLVRNPAMPRHDEDTPLKMFMSPTEALKLAKDQKEPDYAKAVLVSYFMSLRPQELFGLRVGDLRAGEAVFALEASKAMKGIKLLEGDSSLYGGLVVHVSRQRTKHNEFPDPKKNSKGWVACFNRDAAKLLVELLGGVAPQTSVLERAPNKFYKDWPFDFEPKDLRRASLYWLGHSTTVTMQQLMKHARQKRERSLQLYLRRPEEKLEQWTGLNVADL